jgi:succinoglycan biosynthesis protein ExoA
VVASVLVPVFNEERHVARSVAAMQGQRFPGRIEFLLVDGGSTDRTRELLRGMAAQDDRIRLLENPCGATPSALNMALAHARGDWVARMDAHTSYPEDYLARGVARLKRGGTQWVSGPQVAVGRDLVSRAVTLALGTPIGRGGSKKWGAQCTANGGEYELDSGVFDGVWERRTLLDYQGWDERWLRNQDSEMAGRFLANGERLICLEPMAASYTPRSTLKSLWCQYLQYGEYREKTAVRHPHTMRRSHLLAPGLVLTAAAALGAPRLIRTSARAGVAVYVLTLMGAASRVALDGAPPREAALMPVVLAIMHGGHGLGMLRGAIRNGPPLAAIARVFGWERLAERVAPAHEDVYAPSLGFGD